MKAILLLVSFLLPILCFSQTEDVGGEGVGIHFQESRSWQEIKQLAKIQHKYIFVDCFATWCGPCKMMDKNVYRLDSIGAMMDRSFISVKMQLDTSVKDRGEIRARYADARRMAVDYQIQSYPTFLFFTPDGEVVHKGVGYQTPKEFIRLTKEALDQDKQYFTLLKDYQNGRLDQRRMGYLADLAMSFKDKELYRSIAKNSIRGHLDRLTDEELCRVDELTLVVRYASGMSSGDRVFGWLIRHMELVDSVMKRKGLADGLVAGIIYEEEIGNAIATSKTLGMEPNWDSIGRSVTEKYGKKYLRLIYKGEMKWYEYKNDSENLCAAAIKRIEAGEYRDSVQNLVSQQTLNDFAWQVFSLSHDPVKLQKVLSWVDVVIRNIKDTAKFVAITLDTKANLLYKLGRTDEALLLETKAAAIDPEEKEISINLQKMRKGQPTW